MEEVKEREEETQEQHWWNYCCALHLRPAAVYLVYLLRRDGKTRPPVVIAQQREQYANLEPLDTPFQLDKVSRLSLHDQDWV